MEAKKYYWRDKQGNVYGPFRMDEQGNPRGGDVIQHYRLLKHISIKALSKELGKSIRHIHEMEKDNMVPEMISRRQALIRVLGIPPILLFPNLYADDDLVRVEEKQKPPAQLSSRGSGSQDLRYCTEMLQLFWSIYHINGAQSVMDEIEAKIGLLNVRVTDLSGNEQSKALALLCRYRQLAALIAGERDDYQQAFTHLNKAIDIAEKIQDAELQAVSLYRRGLTYHYQPIEDRNLKQCAMMQATADLQKASTFASSIPTTLAGRIQLAAGTAQAHIARTQKEKSDTLALFSKAGKIVRDGRIEENRHFIKLDEGNYHVSKAEAMMAMGYLPDAEEQLQEAHEAFPADQITRHNSINLLQVRLAMQSRQYVIATSTALQAFDIAEQYGMRRNLQMLAGTYNQLLASGYGKSKDVRDLGDKLREWEKKTVRHLH